MLSVRRHRLIREEYSSPPSSYRLLRKDREWVEKYLSIRRIYDHFTSPRRTRSLMTLHNYIMGVRDFVKFLSLSDNPDVVLEKIKGGEIDALREVDEYIDYALERVASGTVANNIYGIKKWFKVNDVSLDWGKIEMPEVIVLEDDKGPTREILQRLLHHAKSSRNRTVILILSSSGLRVGTLVTLRLGDVVFDYPDVARINVYRKPGRKFTVKGSRRGGSNGRSRFYCTFITPEAKEALNEYLKEREQAGEKLTDMSPLIGDNFHKGKFVTRDAILHTYRRILKYAGLDQKSRKWYVYHIHTLRKYFRSNCVGVDISYREFWMGHKGGYLDESYFRAEEKKHLAEYRKAIPYLTVYTSPTDEERIRKKALIDFAKLQGFSPEKISQLEEILAKSKSVEEALETFAELEDREKHDPQKIVTEDELEGYLADGWEIVSVLPSKRIAIRRPSRFANE